MMMWTSVDQEKGHPMQEAQSIRGTMEQFRFADYVEFKGRVPRQALHPELLQWNGGAAMFHIQIQETPEGTLLQLTSLFK
jgi:hypothetical protein